MSELVEFLLARISEDEAAATESCSVNHPTADVYCGPEGHPNVRRLAECEAKRQVVVMLNSELGLLGPPPHEPGNGKASRRAVCEMTLILLALPYAEHPDYREAWRL